VVTGPATGLPLVSFIVTLAPLTEEANMEPLMLAVEAGVVEVELLQAISMETEQHSAVVVISLLIFITAIDPYNQIFY
jgi:ABC-type Fe3+ transport system permease subunit